MYQKNNPIYYAQSLLIQWLACFNYRKYELIKSACENLCEIIGKEKENALYDIFYPLFKSGIIEYAGNSKYTLAPPVLITGKENHCILVTYNPVSDNQLNDTDIPAIYYSNCATELKTIAQDSPKNYKFELDLIFKKFPCIREIVETFDKNPLVTPLSTISAKAKLEKCSNGFTYQLINYEQCTKYDIPDRVQNPDAVNLAGYYERILCETPNGYYNTDNKQLKLMAKSIPIMLYRVLFIHTLLTGHTVEKEKDMYTFSGIPYTAYRELNRILSNSITIQP